MTTTTIQADHIDPPRAGSLGIGYPAIPADASILPPARRATWPDSENCAACLNRHGTVPVSHVESSGYGVTTVEELYCVKCAEGAEAP